MKQRIAKDLLAMPFCPLVMMRKTQASAVKNLLPAIARQAQSSIMAQPCQNALDDLIAVVETNAGPAPEQEALGEILPVFL